jgi:hypothetical protein
MPLPMKISSTYKRDCEAAVPAKAQFHRTFGANEINDTRVTPDLGNYEEEEEIDSEMVSPPQVLSD